MGPMTHGVSFPAGPDGRRSTTARRARRRGRRAARRRPGRRARRRAGDRLAQRLPAALPPPRRGRARHARRRGWRSPTPAWPPYAARMVVAADGRRRASRLDSLATAPAPGPSAPYEVTGEARAADASSCCPTAVATCAAPSCASQLDAWVRARGDRAVGGRRGRRGRRPPRVAAARGPHRGRCSAPARRWARSPPLLRWGATVAAVDLPRAGGVGARPAHRPRAAPAGCSSPSARRRRRRRRRAGADLLAEVPEVADWLAGLDGRLVLGNYLYADGGTHVRVVGGRRRPGRPG